MASQSLVKPGQSQSMGAMWQAHRLPHVLFVHVVQLIGWHHVDVSRMTWQYERLPRVINFWHF
jgi:hypothetical protein